MSRLEFIDDCIKWAKKQIAFYDKKVIENEEYPELQQFSIGELEASEKAFKKLSQIKSILEAWKIIKHTFNILPRYDYNDPEIYILSKDGEKEISQYVSRDEYDKIIKALEIEDENERN